LQPDESLVIEGTMRFRLSRLEEEVPDFTATVVPLSSL